MPPYASASMGTVERTASANALVPLRTASYVTETVVVLEARAVALLVISGRIVWVFAPVVRPPPVTSMESAAKLLVSASAMPTPMPEASLRVLPAPSVQMATVVEPVRSFAVRAVQL